MSFLGDAQELPAIVLAELHIEMLALNLQFFRLDDVIHFCLQPPTLSQAVWGMEEKSAVLEHFSWLVGFALSGPKACLYLPASRGLLRWLVNLQSRALFRTNALEHAATNRSKVL